ncbi:MAG: sugar ABC transporter ATP-binding protein [Coxiella sp. (in: Bacteria)]|nr:MAG: sugar ABC transporter ATP-binding protein [Coxiella sp. (in: g-proteobacteria)]
MSDIIVEADELCVDFPIKEIPPEMKTAEGGAAPGATARFVEYGGQAYLRALDHVSFRIEPGERIGIWGKNGAGKTTLLRAMRGVYPPTSGKLNVVGATQSLFNLAFGLNDDATGWENIILRGVLMGATPEEMYEKSERIADFSELGPFLDMPLRSYSSGMRMRLAFSVATELPSDILLMDEWISVGDVDFRKKVSDRLQAQLQDTRILLIASHNRVLLDQICTRTMTLSEGRIVEWS